MKNVLIKNNLKQIKNTRKRFMSMLVMALLGVGFFAGLYATGPDIRASLDQYLDNTNTYDINVISTLGLTNKDITKLEEIDDVEKAYGIKTKDAEVTINDKDYVAELTDYNENINRPIIIEGRLPENSSECIIEQRFMKMYGYNLEDKICIKDADDNFKKDELTIVGTIESPLYISSNRGNTKLGAGSINCIVYTLDNIDLDYYSNIGIKIKSAKELETDSRQYKVVIEEAKNKIEEIKEERQNSRYNNLINDATEEINKAQKEFDDEKKKGEDEISKAEKKINDGKRKIEKAKTAISINKNKLSQGKAEADKSFKEADKQISAGKAQIEKNKKEVNEKKETFEQGKVVSEKAIKEIDKNIKDLENQKKYLESIGADTSKIVAAINDLQMQKAKIQDELKKGQEEITKAEKLIIDAEKDLNKKEKELNAVKKSTNKKFADLEAKITSAEDLVRKNEKDLKKGEEELEDNKKEFDKKIKDAQQELNDAKKEIEKIEVAKWYILDRSDNSGYDNVTQAVTSIVNLSTLFPAVFYLIAVLISLTSMTRMVEEERVEIGTLKALGYKNSKIISKYIIYAMLASVIGGTIGMFIGLKLLPNIVWTMYSLLYYLPSFDAKLRLGYGIIGTLIAFVCIGGATFIVSHKELKNMPAVLMRPKAPKNGKRVMIEKIDWIWKRLKFSQKVTIRNLFRYKKRVLMTIIGIAGCTSLIVAGFGLKDSITSIVHNQFERINKYDISITINQDKDKTDLMSYLNSEDKIADDVEVNMQTGKLSANGDEKEVKISVPKDSLEFHKVINLIDKETKDIVELSKNGIIITDKVAKLLKVNVGDNVKLIDNNDVEYEFKVDGIVENYVDHYVYMSKNVYEEKMHEIYKTNMILINTNNISNEESEILTKQIVNYDEVSGINLVNSLIVMVENMLSLLNYVVVILIVSAALLALVVLYNLANVNISERRREIATLKVLGFYDNEVDDYINKESIILTIIGIVIGLILGNLLTRFLITTCETEILKFGREISIWSYIYSILITSAFTFIVNKIIHFNLKKIDMIDSLKNVE